jgi:phosphohistidine phosphatase
MRPDHHRELTVRGKHQAHVAGLAIKRMDVEFEALLSSPKARARETAELAGAHWSGAQRGLLETHPPLAGGFGFADARAALELLSADGRVLLVGHEPDFSSVVADFTGARIDLKKGALAVVRLDSSAAGELIALLRPRELALIAADLSTEAIGSS